MLFSLPETWTCGRQQNRSGIVSINKHQSTPVRAHLVPGPAAKYAELDELALEPHPVGLAPHHNVIVGVDTVS